MPFNYAHALLARQAAERTGGKAEAVIAASPAAFRAGAMGPDPYFADAMPGPLFRAPRAGLASRMHALDFSVLLGALAGAAVTPVQRAYTLGFICHFLLDTHAHPYIFARFPGKLHTPGEMGLDLPFIDFMGAEFGGEKPCRYFALSRRELDEIDALHAAAVQTLFSEESRGVFSRSYRKWVYLVNRLSFDPAGRKRRALSRMERVIGKPGLASAWLVTRGAAEETGDAMNLAHEDWAAPWAADNRRRASFPELFGEALAEAPALLDAVAAGFDTGDFSAIAALTAGRCMDGRPVL